MKGKHTLDNWYIRPPIMLSIQSRLDPFGRFTRYPYQNGCHFYKSRDQTQHFRGEFTWPISKSNCDYNLVSGSHLMYTCEQLWDLVDLMHLHTRRESQSHHAGFSCQDEQLDSSLLKSGPKETHPRAEPVHIFVGQPS
jgi:hypothetical protein